MKPTDVQVKELWEGCGFKFMEGDWCYAPDRMYYLRRPPPIDLNNLFKYAMPKVSNYNMCKGLEPEKPVFGQHIAEVWSLTSGYGKSYSKDPALALFWACYPVITGKEVIHGK